MSGIAIPRGIRNNNPGNIRRNDTRWQGLAEQQTDPDFFQFTCAKFGLRAIFRTLHTYQMQDRVTVRQWISAWAPPSDHNDTDAYIAAVCKYAMWQPDAPLSVLDPWHAPLVVAGMVQVENGQQPYGGDIISAAFDLAFPYMKRPRGNLE
jgi:hypothetical protein